MWLFDILNYKLIIFYHVWFSYLSSWLLFSSFASFSFLLIFKNFGPPMRIVLFLYMACAAASMQVISQRLTEFYRNASNSLVHATSSMGCCFSRLEVKFREAFNRLKGNISSLISKTGKKTEEVKENVQETLSSEDIMKSIQEVLQRLRESEQLPDNKADIPEELKSHEEVKPVHEPEEEGESEDEEKKRDAL